MRDYNLDLKKVLLTEKRQIVLIPGQLFQTSLYHSYKINQDVKTHNKLYY